MIESKHERKTWQNYYFFDRILLYNRIQVYVIYIGQIVFDNNLLNMINIIIFVWKI